MDVLMFSTEPHYPKELNPHAPRLLLNIIQNLSNIEH